MSIDILKMLMLILLCILLFSVPSLVYAGTDSSVLAVSADSDLSNGDAVEDGTASSDLSDSLSYVSDLLFLILVSIWALFGLVVGYHVVGDTFG